MSLQKPFAKIGLKTFVPAFCSMTFVLRCKEMSSWLHFDFDDLDSGYVYCCTVSDAQRTIKVKNEENQNMFNFNVFVPVDAINAWQQQITDRRKRANRRWWSCIRINIAGDKFETFMFHQMLLQAATLRMGIFVIILCSFVSCKNSLYYFDIAVHCDTLFMFPELSFLWENTNKFTLRVARLRK